MRRAVIVLCCILPALCGPANAATKNVILMISDGCGYNQILATDLYQYGSPGTQSYEKFPVRYAVSTYPGSTSHAPLGRGAKADCGYDPKLAWSEFDYVRHGFTDSAAAGTAMSCGIKTYNKAICKDLYGNDLRNITQLMKDTGRSAGVVTDVPWSHATPACFAAHNVSRDNYADIAREMIDGNLDVIMGAGHPFFSDDGNPTTTAGTAKNNGVDVPGGYVGGLSAWRDLVTGSAGGRRPWTLIESRAQVVALADGQTPHRVVGTVQAATTTQQSRSGPSFHTTLPYEASLNANEPTLIELSRCALNVVDDNPKGFFLMIEGGAVDWACHTNQCARLIEEETDFDRAVDSVIDWVNRRSSWDDTLLIVTADHETGYLTGPGSGPIRQPMITEIVGKGAGVMPEMQFNYWDHTNSLVPLFAKGSGSELFSQYATHTDPVRGGYIDDTDIFRVMRDAAGIRE